MMKTLGYRLAEARKNAGLTQKQAADRLYLTAQSVSSWECGNSIPDLARVPELAALYGVTADWLLTGKEPDAKILAVTSHLSDRLFNEKRMHTYISAYCTARNLFQTKRALGFAREKHDGQFRKAKDGQERIPYIYHPLLMTCHALALGLAEDDLLAACLLHDVCEDCGVVPEELPVGEAAREAVRVLTKPVNFDDSPEAEEAYYGKIAENRIASVVKLLDRCNNVSSMASGFSDLKMAEYIQETEAYVAPLLQKARAKYPEYANAFFLIQYHMNSVLEALKNQMKRSIGKN